MTAWMQAAWTMQGITETPGDGATPSIVAMFREAGRPDITSDEVAWCAAAVGACLVRGGISLEPIPPARRLLASSYETFGTELPLDQPRVGAIAVLDVGGATGSGRHTGFLAGWTETTVAILGGNQSDAFTVAHFQRSKVVALRWPEPPSTAADLAGLGSRIVTRAQTMARDGYAALSVAATGVAAQAADPGKVAAPAKQAVSGLGDLMTAAETAQRFGAFALRQWPWIAGVMCAWWLLRMVAGAGSIVEARVEDHNTGATQTRRPSDAP